jgi:hypothetical protein
VKIKARKVYYIVVNVWTWHFILFAAIKREIEREREMERGKEGGKGEMVRGEEGKKRKEGKKKERREREKERKGKRRETKKKGGRKGAGKWWERPLEGVKPLTIDMQLVVMDWPVSIKPFPHWGFLMPA